MKYIKTPHNIFQVVGENKLVYKIIGASREKNNIYSKSKKCSDVIAQASHIEDLLDGILFKDPVTNKLQMLDKNNNISILGAALAIESVRGFIETNKGLVYVAKLNEKGEFQLC